MSSRPLLYFNQDGVSDIAALIARYEPKELASPYRSTVPLLALLKESGAALALLEALGVGSDAQLYCEYTVDPPRGRGRASHTDLMIIDSNTCWAIEAKWTEPRYPTVAKWIEESTAGSRRRNRYKVAQGWVELISSRIADSTRIESCLRRSDEEIEHGHVAADITPVVYQMLHRAASACATSNRPALVYLLFHELESLRIWNSFMMCWRDPLIFPSIL